MFLLVYIKIMGLRYWLLLFFF